MQRSVRATLGHAFRALRRRNYRLLFIGQTISLTGSWMQQLALSWLVYRMTGSALLLGVVAFAGQLPGFVIAPIAGVLADRWNRHRIVVATQALMMAQAAAVAVLVLGGWVEVWHLVALATVLGVLTGLDIPARQALFLDLVEGDREDLANAIALNASLFNATRLIGPSLGGFLIARLGEGPVFAINAASYIGVVVSLLAMRLHPVGTAPADGSVLGRLREGFGYAFGFQPVRSLLLLIAAISLVGMPYVVLLPVFAEEILGGGARTLGFLMSAAGLGALGGALYLAGRSSVRGLSRVIVVAGIVFGGGLIGFSFSRTLPLSMALLVVAGAGMMILSASANTVLQTVVAPEMRGRLMSLYTMAFMGMGTFGSLLGGWIGSRLGVSTAVALGGVGCLGAAAWFETRRPALRALIRPIYRELGIIPEVATGILTASELRTKG
ncbi:MAG TPA: MFS transporter [Longimicrobiales bacterium]|nr:MFS transporter [Longimicrobiales bacterium]